MASALLTSQALCTTPRALAPAVAGPGLRGDQGSTWSHQVNLWASESQSAHGTPLRALC